MEQGYINHITMILDQSGSMSGLTENTIKAFDAQIAYLATRSQELDQETRVTVYLFNTKVECVIFDKDVLRLPSIRKHYKANGNTALIDATLRALEELKETPQRYGDHAFLIYVLTDGEENSSRRTASELKSTLARLQDNWTVAVLVPDQRGVFESKKFGFPPENIQVWDTTAKGMEDVGRRIQQVTETYMTQRAVGIRGSRNLFQIDTSNLKAAPTQLMELSSRDYVLFPVGSDCPIKEYVEEMTCQDYVLGNSFYLLMKPEEIQPQKDVIVRNKATGKLYGGHNARTLLNLPDYTVKVAPDKYSQFEIFVQSTSTNRKLIGGTRLLVRV